MESVTFWHILEGAVGVCQAVKHMDVEVGIEESGLGTESMQTDNSGHRGPELQYFRGNCQWLCTAENSAERRGMVRETSR